MTSEERSAVRRLCACTSSSCLWSSANLSDPAAGAGVALGEAHAKQPGYLRDEGRDIAEEDHTVRVTDCISFQQACCAPDVAAAKLAQLLENPRSRRTRVLSKAEGIISVCPCSGSEIMLLGRHFRQRPRERRKLTQDSRSI